MSGADRQEVLDLLHSGRFVDQVPAQVCAALLDADRYLCSVRTMYRILDANQEVRERRNQRRHPVYQKPELLATGPNEVWTWDITKLKGPRKWTYFYLYVILDIFSRQAVGWMVADCESSGLAKKLIRESCDKHRIEQDQLTLHADRGSSMKSKAVALLLSDLGVTQSHSRPYVSVVMHLTQLPVGRAHILWSVMKRADHNILRWFRQILSGGELEAKAVAVGTPVEATPRTRWTLSRGVFGPLRRSASRRHRKPNKSQRTVSRASQSAEKVSQYRTRASKKGFTATVREFIVCFSCCCDRGAEFVALPLNQSFSGTTISSKTFKYNILWCF